jgi:uncharacterized secreted protein with C-terminal beta-propeller domain
MGKTRAWFGLGTTVLLLNTGCDAGSSGTGSDEPEATPGIGTAKVALERATSCDELTASLRADASSKMNRRIDAEIRAVKEGYTYWGRGTVVVPGGGPVNAPSPGAPLAPDAAAESPAPAHSETETQVKGVDEADIVKAVGTRLYVLHGQRLLIVNAWPAANLSLASGIDIEGEPREMFVTDTRAIVFSRTDGSAVYRAAGVTPRGAYSDAYDSVVFPSADIAFQPDRGGGLFANGLTKVTVLELEGDAASVSRELYFEGDYLSSRRIEDQVRVVLQGGAHGPQLDYAPVYATGNGAPTDAQQIQAWEALRVKNQAAIERTGYTDWVPLSFTKAEGGVQAATTACADFYVPTEGSTEFGMTELVTFDLAAPARAPSTLSIVGSAEIVYGNESSIVVASNAYVNPWSLRQAAFQSESSSAPIETLSATHVHRFDFRNDGAPAYTGSGSVPGSAPDQFALDATADHVRIVTNELRSGPYRSDGKQNQVTHLHVLTNRDGRLEIEGKAGEIAPGEQLYATRFVGDMAYVVTWHVTDPLFVIDLHDPANPTVLGELHIPGFSEYMRPLDATHLLTIGRETDDTGHQHTDDNYWYGISIQVFDVTDPLNPLLQHKYVYDGGEYATTEATQNHKAFTYFEDRKLLAFPYVRQYGYGATTSGPSSALEVFHVDVESGIQKLGSVDHSSLLATRENGLYGYCGGYYDGAVRRGVFFEDIVYSVSYGGIEANAVSDLGTPLATLKLESPTMQGLSCGDAAF